MMRPFVYAAAALFLGCFAPPLEADTIVDDTTGSTSQAPTNTSNATSNATSTTDAHASESSDTSGHETTGSTGNSAGTGTETDSTTAPEDPVCDRPIDVAFVVSRNAGMTKFQDRLRDWLPALTDLLSADNVRYLVIDTDVVWGAEECEDTLCEENGGDSCAPLDDTYPCGVNPSQCDITYGAGIKNPVGIGAANTLCTDLPYTSLAPDTDCTLSLGEGTSSNDVGYSIAGLVSPETNSDCNADFARADSILILVIATEHDDTSFSQPIEWIADFTEQRDPTDTLVIGYLGNGILNGSKVKTFIDEFPNATLAPIEDMAYSVIEKSTLQQVCM